MSLPGQRLVLAALLALATLSWAYLWFAPMPMPGDRGVSEPTYIVASLLMWFIMMIAMMTPAVAPVVLLFHRSHPQPDLRARRSAAFVAGYLAVWLAFALVATLLQALLIRSGVVDSMAVSRFSTWSAALLVTAGIYQCLPVKAHCLQHCRDPILFLTKHYRPGVAGAWRTGIAHGTYCLGCCVLLMLLLFVAGAMNLLLVAGLTVLITLEKLAPIGDRLRWLIGALLIAAGGWVLTT